MKKLLYLCLAVAFIFTACKKEVTPTVNANNEQLSNLPSEIGEEDCDDKVKKLEEKIPSEVNLGTTDAGCSIDEVNN